MTITRAIQCQRLGRIEYADALALQKRLVERRRLGEIGDRLLLLEHPAVITTGRNSCEADFVGDRRAIEASGIRIVSTDRGGRLTYHGPGQLVGYCIFDVRRVGGVRAFVHAIEEMLIGTCAEFGITAHRDEHHPGVWVGTAKIAAIGLHISHRISSHGFALNVNCDLEPFRLIVACGLAGRQVTSIARIADGCADMDVAANAVVRHAAHVFDATCELI